MRNRGLSKEGKIYTKPLSLSLSRDAKLFSAIATGSCQKVERARLVKRGTTDF